MNLLDMCQLKWLVDSVDKQYQREIEAVRDCFIC